MGYKQLTQEQKYQISAFLRAGFTDTQIANEIGVHKSTVGREIKRNMFWWGSRIGHYKPDYPQSYCKHRHRHKNKKITFTEDVKNFVKAKILMDWSPEQISGYAKRKGLFSISHERIYQYILTDKNMKGRLYTHLRHQNKKYRKQAIVSIVERKSKKTVLRKVAFKTAELTFNQQF